MGAVPAVVLRSNAILRRVAPADCSATFRSSGCCHLVRRSNWKLVCHLWLFRDWGQVSPPPDCSALNRRANQRPFVIACPIGNLRDADPLTAKPKIAWVARKLADRAQQYFDLLVADLLAMDLLVADLLGTQVQNLRNGFLRKLIARAE